MNSNNNQFLIQSSIATTTNNKYNNALINFKQYIHQHNYKLHKLTPNQLDNVLVNYIHYLHTSGASLSTANYTLASLHRTTGFGSALYRSRLSLKGWSRIHARTRKHRPPLTLEVTTLISVTLARSGHYNAGIATLVAFHCYLRINEFCKLKNNEVVFAGDARMGSGMNAICTLKLAVTKTGLNQSVSIRCQSIANLLKSVIVNNAETGSTNSFVFGLTSLQYRRLFHSACEHLGFGNIGYTPHSLRHGGATFDSMKGVPVNEIVHRGRWRNETSLTTYVQVGSVLLLDTNLSSTMFESAVTMYKHIEIVMNICKKMNQ